MGLACVVRLQVSNVSARNCLTTGVQAPPTLSTQNENAERGKVVTPPGPAIPGKPTVRQADGGTAMRKSEQANAPPVTGGDTV